MKKEYLTILRELEQHHALFGRFWAVGSLVEDEKIPTACISFDRKSGAGIQFKVNPTFWGSCDLYKKTFILAHECSHVYFEHGRRMRHMDPKLANIAADIVVNHFLCDGFGFNREKIQDWQNYCWIDTVFPGDKSVLPHQCFEYYYQLLLKKQQQQPKDGKGQPQKGGKGDGQPGEGKGQGEPQEGEGEGTGEPQTVDSHEQLDELSERILEEIASKLSQEELEEFQDISGQCNDQEVQQASQNPGSTAGTLSRIIALGRVVKKKKWETVVKNVLGRLAKEKDIIVEQWAHPNRRLAAMPSELMLPNEVEETVFYRDRIDVWFFQDTSRSCKHLAQRFFKAAASIPEDKFRVRMFCFDTAVYETTLKSGKLYGFGGTTFTCIEQHIQHLIATEKGTLYPSVVFLVTDGWGNVVRPQFAERWHWFLSEQKKDCIPSESKTYDLAKFE